MFVLVSLTSNFGQLQKTKTNLLIVCQKMCKHNNGRTKIKYDTVFIRHGWVTNTSKTVEYREFKCFIQLLSTFSNVCFPLFICSEPSFRFYQRLEKNYFVKMMTLCPKCDSNSRPYQCFQKRRDRALSYENTRYILTINWRSTIMVVVSCSYQ